MGAKVDITGQRFGRLVAIEPTEKRYHGNIVWKCQCDCGKVYETFAGTLIRGHTKSCGCLWPKDLSGQRFGRLVVIEPTEKRLRECIVWKCQCDCGNTHEASGDGLIQGNIKSCGCSRKSDLTGQRFGRLVAIEPTNKKKNGSIVWKCQCDCGNMYEAAAMRLVQNRIESCGCVPNKHMIVLTGQRFGRLVAIEPLKKRRASYVIWKCQCDCGNIHEVSSSCLIQGHTKSCGCISKKSGNVDLTGKRFGMLVAIERTDKRRKGAYLVWKCQCDCGSVLDVPQINLLGGVTKSCGCFRKERGLDLTGQRFGLLTAIQPTERRWCSSVVWKCQCDCGSVKWVPRDNLVNGNTNSCGCLTESRHRRVDSPGTFIDLLEESTHLTGRRFGLLVAVQPTDKQRKGSIIWECQCDCGNSHRASRHDLLGGIAKSCGCLLKKNRRASVGVRHNSHALIESD